MRDINNSSVRKDYEIHDDGDTSIKKKTEKPSLQVKGIHGPKGNNFWGI